MSVMSARPKYLRQMMESNIKKDKNDKYNNELYLLISNGKIKTKYGMDRSDFLIRKIKATS